MKVYYDFGEDRKYLEGVRIEIVDDDSIKIPVIYLVRE